jgi:haloacetate dehalogenase
VLEGFTKTEIETSGARIVTVHGGKGPPLLLLHGNPFTHLSWHKFIDRLAQEFTVVATDLRGYGDSARPGTETPGQDATHALYAKRTMARDQVAVMRALGHERFAVVGHDRGGRVAHRMSLDHPAVVEQMAVLDIAPTATMYARADADFARRYFWWFFLIQDHPLPERLIGGDPDFFLDTMLAAQLKVADVAAPVLEEYRRCFRDPAARHAMCEDYRAAASVDLEHDAADAASRVEVPLLALWGDRGVVGATYDVLQTWREKATSVTGDALPCGHCPQEEVPDLLHEALLGFLRPRT